MTTCLAAPLCMPSVEVINNANGRHLRSVRAAEDKSDFGAADWMRGRGRGADRAATLPTSNRFLAFSDEAS